MSNGYLFLNVRYRTSQHTLTDHFTAVHFGEFVGQVPVCFEFLLLYCTYETELKEGPEILLAFAENRACFLNKEPTKDLSLQK